MSALQIYMAENGSSWMFAIRLFMGFMYLMTGMMKIVVNSIFEGIMFDRLREGSLLFAGVLDVFAKDNSVILYWMLSIGLGMFEMLLGFTLLVGFAPRLGGLGSFLMLIPLTLAWIPNDAANTVALFWVSFMMHVIVLIGFSYLLWTRSSLGSWAPGQKWVPEALKNWQ